MYWLWFSCSNLKEEAVKISEKNSEKWKYAILLLYFFSLKLKCVGYNRFLQINKK